MREARAMIREADERANTTLTSAIERIKNTEGK
jgi:hypothetical protein